MNIEALRDIGLTENEIKIYLDLLGSGSSTAYDIGKRTGVYRVHVYDKLEQLMDKGMVTHIYRGAKKYFQATSPEKIRQYIEEKKAVLASQEASVTALLPKLEALAKLPKEDTFVEVFKGPEGLKYLMKDFVREGKEILITGIDDQKFQETLPVFMKQYFRDLKNKRIKERIITLKRKGIFQYSKKEAPTTEYRFLESTQFNPANTLVYGNSVVITIWGSPVTAVRIRNKDVADTYRNHFEHLWSAAAKAP